ncbi:MAG: thiamine phosphate synthase [Planctomycetes bacterium]|nr:thiamine phosphate synthase [Planctomycetota bacterium]
MDRKTNLREGEVLRPGPTAVLQLLLDPREGGPGGAGVLAAVLDGGVDLVQLRMKAATTAERIAAARVLCRELAPRAVPLLINDDVAAAVELGPEVAGVHLGQDDLSVSAARARLGPGSWIGQSTHSVAELCAATAVGATHFGLGACFATATKTVPRLLTAAELRAATAVATRPLYAIGGITPENVGRLVDCGVSRVAVSSALLTATDPRAAAAALRRALARTAPPPPRTA